MADDPVVGGVTVEIKGDPAKFDAALASSQQKAQAFDATASASMGNVGKAATAASTDITKLANTMLAAGASAADVAKALGTTEKAVLGAASASKAAVSATEALTNGSKKAADAQKVLDKSLSDVAARADKLRASLDPLSAAKIKLANATKEASDLEKAGAITTAESAAAMALAEQAYKKAADGLHTVSGASSTTTRELLVLGREAARGNFTRMAGSSTILAGSLGLLKPAVIGVTIGVVALIAAIAAVEVATIQYNAEQEKLTATLLGTGAASGLSASQINAASDTAMRASGQSIQAMTAASEAFASAGVTQASTIAQLDASIGTYAELTGVKAAEAQKTLAAAMADPAKGAVELNNQLGILDQTTLDHIKSLAAMGDKEGAVAVLTDALRHREDEANAAGVGLRNSFDNLKLGATFLWQEIAKVNNQLILFSQFGFGAGAAGAAQQHIRDMATSLGQNEAKINKASTDAGTVAADTPEGKDAAARQDLQDRATKLRAGIAAEAALEKVDPTHAGDHAAQYLKDVQALNEVTHGITTYRSEVQKKVDADALDVKISEAKHAHNKQLVADLTQQKALLGESGKIESDADALALAHGAGEKAGAAGGKGPKGKKDTFAPQQASIEADTAGEIALADAYLDSDAAAIKAEASRKALTEATKAGRTEAQKAAFVQNEINLDVAKEAADGAKKVAGLAAQEQADRKANDAVAAGTATRAQANETAKTELELRPLIAAASIADGAAKAALTKVIEALRAAQAGLNDEDTRTKEIDQTSSNNDQIAMLKLRLSLVNATAQQRDVALARAGAAQSVTRENGDPTKGAGLDVVNSAGAAALLQAQVQGAEQMRAMTLAVQAETTAFQKQGATLGMTLEQADKYNELQKLIAEAKKDGITLDSTETSALDKLASGYATAADAARKLSEAQKGALDATKSLSSSFTQSIEGMVFDGKSLTATAHDLAKSLGKEGLEAVLDGSGPLAGLFGTGSSKVVGGANGGVLSQLFGSLFKVPGASPSNVLGGGKGPSGTQADPIYVAPGVSLTGGGSSNPISSLISMLTGGGGSAAGTAAGASAGSDIGDSLAGMFHDGVDSVGSGGQRKTVPTRLFASAPRLHTGLAPDEFPAILQRGERVKSRAQVAAERGGTNVAMHVHVSDAASFGRSKGQVTRAVKRAMA